MQRALCRSSRRAQADQITLEPIETLNDTLEKEIIMTRPITRRSIISTGAMSLATLSPLVARFAQDASAKKNTGKKPLTAAQRANSYIGTCFELGGEPTVDAVKPGGTTVTCKTDNGSETCTFTSKKGRCDYQSNMTHPGGLPGFEPAPTNPVPGGVPNVPIVPAGGDLTLTSSDGTSRNRRKR